LGTETVYVVGSELAGSPVVSAKIKGLRKFPKQIWYFDSFWISEIFWGVGGPYDVSHTCTLRKPVGRLEGFI